MKHTAVRTTGMFAVAALVAVFGGVPTAIADGDKVTLCHATDSSANPYVVKTVSESSIFNNGIVPNGHGADTGGIFDPSGGQNQPKWGDIIPAFGGVNGYRGLNISTGQLWLDGGCTPPRQLTLIKLVNNNAGGDAGVNAWTLDATGGPTAFAEGYSGAHQMVAEGAYALSESTGGPANYIPSAWNCGTAKLIGHTVTVKDNDVTCTITNTYRQPLETGHATLTLVKNVIGDSAPLSAAEDFTLYAEGAKSFHGITGTSFVTNVEVSPGKYVLSESPDNAPSYTALGWSCQGAANLAASVVTLVANDNAVCTITNEYAPPPLPAHLTLVKSVKNDGGGTQPASAWTLWADGPISISGKTRDESVTSAEVNPGAYVLRETGTQTNYNASAWRCGDVNLTEGHLTLVADQTVTCTITNTYSPPKLALVKEVVNTYGEPAAKSAWTLQAKRGDTTTISGAGGFSSTTVPAGSYTLSESPSESPGPADYTPGAWSCTAGSLNEGGNILTLAADQSATCTIKNTYKPTTDGSGGGIQPVTTTSASLARITLSATVENHFGGKAKVSDFTLTATGQLAPAAAEQNSFTPLAVSGTTPISFSGITGAADITNAAVPAGTYALSVSALPQRYSKSAWVCTGGEQSRAEFTVRLGQSVSCNISILDSAASVIPTVVTPVLAGEVVTAPPTKVPTKVVKGAVVTKAPVATPKRVTQLAFTGAETVPLGLSGLLALLLGVGLILVSRRRATD